MYVWYAGGDRASRHRAKRRIAFLFPVREAAPDVIPLPPRLDGNGNSAGTIQGDFYCFTGS
jgi:hypothetical protein